MKIVDLDDFLLEKKQRREKNCVPIGIIRWYYCPVFVIIDKANSVIVVAGQFKLFFFFYSLSKFSFIQTMCMHKSMNECLILVGSLEHIWFFDLKKKFSN